MAEYKHRHTILIFIVILVILLTCVSTDYPVLANNNSNNISVYLRNAYNSINITQIKDYADKLSEFNRVTGYPGNLEAAMYIENVLKADGIKVINQSFTSAVPVDTGSWISIGNKNFTVYALWPNGPVPGYTPAYVSGPLVYVENGTWNDMNGKPIYGSIVLENFNSGSNWLNAAELGAKAIVFLAPATTTAIQSTLKANPSPIYMPRVYAEGSAAKVLLLLAKNQTIVDLHDGMIWKNVTSYNIIGIVNGTNSKNIIIASAHFDSWSVVPAIAPGGQDALGISSLLDFAHYLAQNKPYRTVWLVAYSGYWEGLVGPYAFVKKYVYSPWNLAGTTKIWMDIDLDFSSATPNLDALYYDYFNNYNLGGTAEIKYQSYLGPLISQFFSSSSVNQTLRNGIPAVSLYMSGSEQWGTQPSYYMLAVDPLVQSNTLGFTLRTSFDQRNSWLTPINNLNLTNWANVEQEAKTSALIIAGFADIPVLGLSWSSDAPIVLGSDAGFAQINIKVVQFNFTSGWYSAVPNVLVQVSKGPSQNPDWWEFGNQWFITNKNGQLTYYGAIGYESWSCEAWKINSSSGQIDYAPNDGVYGLAHGVSGGLSLSVPMVIGNPSYISVPIFECNPVTAYNIIDPRDMIEATVADPRNIYSNYISESPVASVYKFVTGSTPTFYYLFYDPESSIMVAFVQKGEDVVLTYTSDPQVGQQVILDNASNRNPSGAGYTINGPIVINKTFYEEAKDMYLLVQARYGKLSLHYASNPALTKLNRIAAIYLGDARGNITEENYSAAYNDSLVAWAYSSDAYSSQLMPMYGQISTSMDFFVFLIIPFSYFFEEYAFNFKGFKRILAIFIIMGIFLYIFSQVNPALSAISNAGMAVISVGLLIFWLFIVWVFYGDIKKMFEEGIRSRLGSHEMASSTQAASSYSATVSVQNMRRRPLMSTLTLLTIVIFTAGSVAFTSTSPNVGITTSTSFVPGMPKSEAIVVKWYTGVPPTSLGERLMNYVSGVGGGSFKYWPEYVYYPTLLYSMGPYSQEPVVPVVDVENNKTFIAPIAFIGWSSGEANEYLNKSLVKGQINLGYNSILIPNELAKAINASIGSSITFLGVGTFKVTGIFNASEANAEKSANGMSVPPVNPLYDSIVDEGYSYPVKISIPPSLSFSNVVIIDWQRDRALGGFLSSIEMIPINPMNVTQITRRAQLIRLPIEPTVYVRHNGYSTSLSSASYYIVMGFSIVLVLLILAALAILNAMYENVQFRRNEIYVYSSLGISPSGAAAMFLMESLVYAIIGAVIGFLLGFGLDYLFIYMHVLPTNFNFNFTSWSMMLSIVLIIFVTIAGSLYPSRMSSRLITPSLTRKWKPSSRPKGGVWELELPMRVLTEEEGLGVLRFFSEYYNGVGFEKTTFRTEKTPVLDENNKQLTVIVRLAPFEANITQEVVLRFINTSASAYQLIAKLTYLTGDENLWSARSSTFVLDLRAQLILWRGISPSERAKYLNPQRHPSVPSDNS